MMRVSGQFTTQGLISFPLTVKVNLINEKQLDSQIWSWASLAMDNSRTSSGKQRLNLRHVTNTDEGPAVASRVGKGEFHCRFR